MRDRRCGAPARTRPRIDIATPRRVTAGLSCPGMVFLLSSPVLSVFHYGYCPEGRIWRVLFVRWRHWVLGRR